MQLFQARIEMMPLTPVKPVQLVEVVPPLLHVAQGQADDLGVCQGGLSGFHVEENPTLSVGIDSALLLVGCVQYMGRRWV